jgi:hypothetical protein
MTSSSSSATTPTRSGGTGKPQLIPAKYQLLASGETGQVPSPAGPPFCERGLLLAFDQCDDAPSRRP